MPETTTAARAVFLSYAHEDAEPVRRIADALRAFGVEVWFDQNELRGGDAWDAKIRTQIRSCTLCVPVISATTQARGEGYFRREWKIAVERTHDMAAGVPFLLPVVIDDTPETEALVPDEFMRVQWTRLPRGVPTSQFVEQVKKQLEGKPSPAARPRIATVSGEGTPPPKKSGAVVWTSGTVAVIVAIAVATGVFRHPEPPAAVAEVKTTPAAAKPERLADKSIAVLPFTNMSEDKDANAFFADGIHEDILTNLALVRELRIVSRTSVLSYRNTTKPMKQIAQELGVTYILEGSVRRVGNKVRITGQLIHAATDEHVWAQAYDRDLTDVFAIQSELSREIAGALKAALSPEEKILIARKPTENPEAYDLFLQARDVYNRQGISQGTSEERVKLLEQAVALDAKFAQAWAELADAYAYAGFIFSPGMDEYLARAKAAMDRAVALAPEDSEVIRALGTYYYYGFRDYGRAIEQYERLLVRQPNDPSLHYSLGLIQRRKGNWARALEHLRRALELDPANIRMQRGLISTLIAARRYPELEAAQRRLTVLRPDNLTEAATLKAIPFVATGSTKEGDAFLAALPPEKAASPEAINVRKIWARLKGDFAEAVRLDKLQPYYDEGGDLREEQALFAAFDYFATGDKEAARARLGDYGDAILKRLAAEPRNARLLANCSGVEVLRGNPEAARRYADDSVRAIPLELDALDGATYAIIRVQTYESVGEKDYAISEYQRLLQVPCAILGLINVHALKAQLSSLRDDPRWQALLADPKNNAPLF